MTIRRLSLDDLIENAIARAKEKYPVEMQTRSKDEQARLTLRVLNEMYPLRTQAEANFRDRAEAIVHSEIRRVLLGK